MSAEDLIKRLRDAYARYQTNLALEAADALVAAQVRIDYWRRQAETFLDRLEDTRSRLAEVEKERDEWRETFEAKGWVPIVDFRMVEKERDAYEKTIKRIEQEDDTRLREVEKERDALREHHIAIENDLARRLLTVVRERDEARAALKHMAETVRGYMSIPPTRTVFDLGDAVLVADAALSDHQTGDNP